MSETVDELIREIAVRHGLAVSRDDPILILHTINSRLLQESAQAQEAQLDRFREELEGLSARWSIDVRDKSQRILNASLSASKAAMQDTLQQASATCIDRLHAEFDAHAAKVSRCVSACRMLACCSVLASCATVTAMAWGSFG